MIIIKELLLSIFYFLMCESLPRHYHDIINQGWGEYHSGTHLVQNGKHEYTKNIVLEYYWSTDFPVLVLVC